MAQNTQKVLNYFGMNSFTLFTLSLFLCQYVEHESWQQYQLWLKYYRGQVCVYMGWGEK